MCRETIRSFKIFKKPCRETCLCPHCQKRKELVQWLNNKSNGHYGFDLYHSHKFQLPSSRSWSRYVDIADRDEFARKLSLLSIYDHHLRMHERVLSEQRVRRENHPIDFVTWKKRLRFI